jgi:prolipoprotein diacylglyceryltransferase
MIVFGFRFVVEFWKVPQSAYIDSQSLLTMGQYLSIPMFILGLLFFFYGWMRRKGIRIN